MKPEGIGLDTFVFAILFGPVRLKRFVNYYFKHYKFIINFIIILIDNMSYFLSLQHNFKM